MSYIYELRHLDAVQLIPGLVAMQIGCVEGGRTCDLVHWDLWEKWGVFVGNREDFQRSVGVEIVDRFVTGWSVIFDGALEYGPGCGYNENGVHNRDKIIAYFIRNYLENDQAVLTA